MLLISVLVDVLWHFAEVAVLLVFYGIWVGGRVQFVDGLIAVLADVVFVL